MEQELRTVRRETKRPQTFGIFLTRLPKLDETPGLILLTVGTGGTEPPTRIGVLTDSALRGRLAHFDLHSANEIAKIRQLLKTDSGQATLYEAWSGFESCLQFWYGFFGSQVRPVEWTCEKCAAANREDVASTAGEAFSRACACGQVKSITIGRR
jgi:hypothetical protein